MTRTTLLILLLVLAFMGIADSAYLAESAVTDTALSCDVAGFDGCNAVAQSPYSQLFGIPLGMYGLLFYGLVLVLAAAALTLKIRDIGLYLLLVTGVGAVCSVIFLLIQLFVIHALCIYCVASAVISYLAFWIAWALRNKHPVVLH